MTKTNIFFVVLIVMGAFGAFIIETTQKDPFDKVQPCDLIDIISQTNKYVTTDELARKIMSDDPTIMLIDLRTKAEYEKYSLTGAINIPLANLMDEQYKDILNQNVRTLIFYSNSSDLAVKAWMLTSRLTYKNIFILKGGLNRWVETILKPKEPRETALRTEFEMYSFRKAASSYFGGGSTAGDPVIKKVAKFSIKRKKKSAAGGGCD